MIAVNSTKKYISLILLLVIVACNDATDQKKEEVKQYTPPSPELFTDIAYRDSVMFDAFNAHDLASLMSFFDSSLEFYHDKGGVSNFAKNKELLGDLFTRNKATGLRRDIVPGSMEVYPVPDYGAIETGLHRFCHEENGKQDCGSFKFVHIWKKMGNEWKITRVVSYDH